MSNIKLFTKNNIRIYVSDMTDIVKKSIEVSNAAPMAALTLGTAIAVFGPLATIKRNTKTTAILNGTGLLKSIIVDSNDKGHVRASVGVPSIVTDFDKTNPNGIPLVLGIGESGTLKILQTSGDFTFSGEVKLAKGDIVTDMAYYYEKSEQTKTANLSSVILGPNSHVERAYGVFMQMLPGYTEEDIQWVEEFTKNNKLGKMKLEDYIKAIKADVLEEKKLIWKCNCSKEKFEAIIATLSEKEKADIIKEHGVLEITCNFCKTRQQF